MRKKELLLQLFLSWAPSLIFDLAELLIQFVPDPRFEEVKEFVRSGVFGSYNYDELIGSLEGNEGFGCADYFLVGKDFPSYIECQEKVDEAYQDQKVSYICSYMCMPMWCGAEIYVSTIHEGRFSFTGLI